MKRKGSEFSAADFIQRDTRGAELSAPQTRGQA